MSDSNVVVKVGQVWRDLHGNDYEVTGFSDDHRFAKFDDAVHGIALAKDGTPIFDWKLISDAPSVEEPRAKVDCAACNHWSDPVHDCPNAWTYAPPAPASQSPKLPTPRYAVGDRFVYGDGSVCEIVELNVSGEPYDVRHTDHDEITLFADSDFDVLFEDGWLRHISGPSYRAPAIKPAPSCNCSAQITGSEHRSWCRIQGGGL